MALTPIEALNKVVENRVAIARLTGFRFLANLAEAGRIFPYYKTNIDWDVEVGGSTAAWEAVTANSAGTGTADVVPANLRIGQYRLKHQFNISKISIQEAASVAPSDLTDLFGAHTDRALNILMRTLNTAIYLGDGTATYGQMIGLAKLADPTYAYAGVNPTTYPAWVPNALTNAGVGRALTRNLMLDLDEQMALKETMYDFVLTHPTTAKKYVQLFDTIAGESSVPIREGEAGLKSVDLGHGGRYWNGYPLIEDNMAPVGTIHTFNLADLELKCFELSNSPGANGVGGHKVNRSYGIPIHITELASANSAVRTFEFAIYPQLRLFNRKSYSLIGDLS